MTRSGEYNNEGLEYNTKIELKARYASFVIIKSID